jgi:hypothetical protein
MFVRLDVVSVWQLAWHWSGLVWFGLAHWPSKGSEANLLRCCSCSCCCCDIPTVLGSWASFFPRCSWFRVFMIRVAHRLLSCLLSEGGCYVLFRGHSPMYRHQGKDNVSPCRAYPVHPPSCFRLMSSCSLCSSVGKLETKFDAGPVPVLTLLPSPLFHFPGSFCCHDFSRSALAGRCVG